MSKKTADQYPDLQEAINSAIKELESLTADSPEYKQTVKQIVKLDAVLNGQKPKKTALSKDAILSASVYILGLLVVIEKERAGAIVSKAFAMIRKA